MRFYPILQLPIDKCQRSSKITYAGSQDITIKFAHTSAHTLFTPILQPWNDETHIGQVSSRVEWNGISKETNKYTIVNTQGARTEQTEWKQ